MQRPVMNPTFVLDLRHPPEKPSMWRQRGVAVLKWLWRGLMSNPLAVTLPGQTAGSASAWTVALRMVVCWGLILPIVVVLSAFGLVFRGTHPQAAAQIADPSSQGCYYETVDFTSGDGTLLTGWLVPAVDAKRVVAEKDRALHTRRPAVVLVHDYGQSPQQMLPLVKPLHDEGVNVLVIGARGAGTPHHAAQTFGINESQDVLAAVALLKENRFVDPSRIAVGGIGTGANATMIALSGNRDVRAAIVIDPLRTGEDGLATRIVPARPWLRWMRPLCKSVFEALESANLHRADAEQYSAVLKDRPSLVLNVGDSYVLHEPAVVKQVVKFCRRTLHTQDLPVLGRTG